MEMVLLVFKNSLGIRGTTNSELYPHSVGHFELSNYHPKIIA